MQLSNADILIDLKRRLGPDDFEIAYITLWQLWYRRNLLVHQDRSYSIVYWQQQIIFARDEFLHLNAVLTNAGSVEATTSQQKWSPPFHNVIKINVDAAQVQGVSQVGIVARNNAGVVCFATVKKYHVTYPPAISEALAIRFGLQCAMEEDLLSCVLESDCL